jgi:phosphoribosylaminoimidazole-succinocarboxamide synthase
MVCCSYKVATKTSQLVCTVSMSKIEIVCRQIYKCTHLSNSVPKKGERFIKIKIKPYSRSGR